MKKVNTKISALAIFLVILGTIFANIQTVTATVTKNQHIVPSIQERALPNMADNAINERIINNDGVIKSESSIGSIEVSSLNSKNDTISDPIFYDDPIDDFLFETQEFVLDPGEGGNGGTTDMTFSHAQGFEFEAIPQSCLTYANPSFFSRQTSSSYIKDGDYSLKATPTSSGGKIYDGIQFDLTFSDGSIEAWFYPKDSNSLTPALWLRTTTLSSTADPSFADGYMLRIYTNEAKIYSRDITHGWTVLASYSLGEYIANKWWHMKFEADGTLLKAWVTKNAEFTTSPQFSHDTENDNDKFCFGKPGISVRTSMTNSLYPTYIDSVLLEYSEVYYESFEPKDLINPTLPTEGINYANCGFYSISNTLYYNGDNGSYSLKATPASSGGKVYDGIQFDQTFVDGSIEAWFYPKYSNSLTPALWLRTSTISSSADPSFADGYMLRLYTNEAKMYVRNSTTGWSILASYSLGEYIANKWWHMKFEANGTLLKAWVTKDDAFTSNPQFYYDTNDDDNKIYYGKPGISVRTSMTLSMYLTYMDAVKIDIYDDFDSALPLMTGYWNAYSEYGELKQWNLKLEADLADLNDYLLGISDPFTHGRLVQISITEFQYVKNLEGYYTVESTTVTFDVWMTTEADTCEYFNIVNLKKGGIAMEKDSHFINFDELIAAAEVNSTKAAFYGVMAGAGGVIATIGGIFVGIGQWIYTLYAPTLAIAMEEAILAEMALSQVTKAVATATVKATFDYSTVQILTVGASAALLKGLCITCVAIGVTLLVTGLCIAVSCFFISISYVK